MAKKVKIKIVDFYSKLYDKIREIIEPEYELEISDDPDFLIYGPYGTGLEHYKYHNCIKICWCAEGIVPDFNECDYGMGSFPMTVVEDRYLRVPYCAPPKELLQREIINQKALDRNFCNFIYSNANRGEGASLRIQFCKELMKYKKVDCPGNVLHNMEGNISERSEKNWWSSKSDFVSNYKFTISFENVRQPGMISEKIMNAFEGNSLPIYWGAPDIYSVYAENSFLNLSNCNTVAEMVDEVVRLDQDDELYLEMLNNSPISKEFDWGWEKKRKEWFLNILENGTKLNCDPLGYDSGIASAKKIIKLSQRPLFRIQENLAKASLEYKNKIIKKIKCR